MSTLSTISGYAWLPALPNWDEPVRLTLRWSGEEEVSLRGNEERETFRSLPRADMEWQCWPGDLEAAQTLRHQMRWALDQYGGKVATPLWARPTVVLAGVAGASTVFPVLGAWDWQVGDKVAAVGPAGVVVRTVASYSYGAGITVDTGFGFDISTNDLLYPLLFGRLSAESATAWDGDTWEQPLRVTGDLPHRAPLGVSPTVTLTRPIFLIPADWAAAISRTLTYQPRSAELGAQVVDEAMQKYAVTALSLPIALMDEGEIAQMDALACAVLGAQQGWWLPSPERWASVTAGVDSTHFDVRAQGLAEIFATEPAVYLWCVDPAGVLASQAVRVTAVAALGATERITLATAPAQAVDARYDLHRLRYVRLAKSELTFSHDEPMAAEVQLSVVELPHEYAAADLGERPASLFRIVKGATTWRWTSHDVAVTVSAETFTPQPIEHGEVSESVDGKDNGVQIQTWRVAGGPFTEDAPFAPEEDIKVTILRYDLQSLGSPEVLYDGVVDRMSLTGRRIEVTVATLLARMSEVVPAFLVQRRDNFPLYSGANGIDRATRTRTATVTAVSEVGRVLRLQATGVGSLPASYHLFGEVLAGTKYRQIEAVSIVNANTIDVRLEHPFPTPPAVSSTVSLTEGYDASAEAAITQFSNLINFGGHRYIDENLALKAVELRSGGGKK